MFHQPLFDFLPTRASAFNCDHLSKKIINSLSDGVLNDCSVAAPPAQFTQFAKLGEFGI